MKKTKQKVTFYSVLVNGVVIKDFKSHAPASAYKNIDEVMANQQDLVKILTRLSPIAVVKG